MGAHSEPDLTAGAVATKAPKTTRGLRTREKIVTAAQEIFARDGYVGGRVVDIAQTAGISLGSFYTYFDDKDDVLAASLESVFEEMYAASRAPWADEPAYDAIRNGLGGYVFSYSKNRAMLRVMREAVSVHPTFAAFWFDWRGRFLARIVRNVERSQELGTTPAMNATLAASCLGGMLDDFCWIWLGMGGDAVPAVGKAEELALSDAVDVLAALWYRALFSHEPIPARSSDTPEPWSQLTVTLAERPSSPHEDATDPSVSPPGQQRGESASL